MGKYGCVRERSAPQFQLTFASTRQQWQIQKFRRGKGGRQCISPDVIYRKCTQRIYIAYGKRLFEKKISANRGRPPTTALLNPPLLANAESIAANIGDP